MYVAKAALESAVRYLAAELGPKGIPRARRIARPFGDAGCFRISEFDTLLAKAKVKAPARSLVSIDDVRIATAFLAHNAARLMNG
jgi:enoyl-[acyl-carrier protein] reductase I